MLVGALAAVTISAGFTNTTTDRLSIADRDLGDRRHGGEQDRRPSGGTGGAGTIFMAAGPWPALCRSDQRADQHQRLDTPQQQYGYDRRARQDLRWNRRGILTLVMTLALPEGTVVSGANTILFRFNRTDGVVSSYRVLAWNFLTGEGKKIIPPNDFEQDEPEAWTPPLPDAASILAGRELWQTASLAANSLPNSPRILAHCADCHAQDGRDLSLQLFQCQHYRPRSLPWTIHAAERGDRKLHSKLALAQSGPPLEPPYQPGPGMDATDFQLGGRRRARLGSGERYGTLPYLVRQHGTGLIQSR